MATDWQLLSLADDLVRLWSLLADMGFPDYVAMLVELRQVLLRLRGS